MAGQKAQDYLNYFSQSYHLGIEIRNGRGEWQDNSISQSYHLGIETRFLLKFYLSFLAFNRTI